ncbi:MAG: zinc-dependent dehydrogenase [Thermodesulfovibrionia bacterium]
MRVARLYSFNDIRIEDVDVPEPGDNDALMSVRACGICSGDVMKWYIEKKAPLVIGHEPSGEIVRVGRAVKGFKSGDRIFVHHHAPCMKCRFCMRGDYVQCEEWKRSRIIPGGISEYILIPDGILRNDTLLLPEDVGYDDATLIEPTACVVKSLRRAGVKRGDVVLVIGLGVMGMLHILLLRDIGVERIIGADMVEFRLNKAVEFGADYVVDVKREVLKDTVIKLTEGRGADIVIVCPNSVSAMMDGFECVAPGGRVVLFTPAMPDERLVIDPNRIYFNDISVITSYSCGPDDTRKALDYIKRGVIRGERLITHRFGIDDTITAYKIVARAEDSLKVIITFG